MGWVAVNDQVHRPNGVGDQLAAEIDEHRGREAAGTSENRSNLWAVITEIAFSACRAPVALTSGVD
jgi:hypothetical protein